MPSADHVQAKNATDGYSPTQEHADGDRTSEKFWRALEAYEQAQRQNPEPWTARPSSRNGGASHG